MHGLEIPNRILNSEYLNYETGNGASVLICNLLYKNEEMKTYFGEHKVVEALTNVNKIILK